MDIVKVADRVQETLVKALPENVSFILILKDSDGAMCWNTNMTIKREAAEVFREFAEDLAANGPPPERPLDG